MSSCRRGLDFHTVPVHDCGLYSRTYSSRYLEHAGNRRRSGHTRHNHLDTLDAGCFLLVTYARSHSMYLYVKHDGTVSWSLAVALQPNRVLVRPIQRPATNYFYEYQVPLPPTVPKQFIFTPR